MFRKEQAIVWRILVLPLLHRRGQAFPKDMQRESTGLTDPQLRLQFSHYRFT